MFAQVFDNKPVDEITAKDFRSAAAKLDKMETDLTHWTFGGSVLPVRYYFIFILIICLSAFNVKQMELSRTTTLLTSSTIR